MAVIFKHKKAVSKLTWKEKLIREERCTKLMELFWEVYTQKDIAKLGEENSHYIIDGDLDFLDVSIGVPYD